MTQRDRRRKWWGTVWRHKSSTIVQLFSMAAKQIFQFAVFSATLSSASPSPLQHSYWQRTNNRIQFTNLSHPWAIDYIDAVSWARKSSFPPSPFWSTIENIARMIRKIYKDFVYAALSIIDALKNEVIKYLCEGAFEHSVSGTETSQLNESFDHRVKLHLKLSNLEQYLSKKIFVLWQNFWIPPIIP